MTTPLQKWIKANPRHDWKPTASSKICSIHFNDDDFEVSSVETNQDRRKKTEQKYCLDSISSDDWKRMQYLVFFQVPQNTAQLKEYHQDLRFVVQLQVAGSMKFKKMLRCRRPFLLTKAWQIKHQKLLQNDWRIKQHGLGLNHEHSRRPRFASVLLDAVTDQSCRNISSSVWSQDTRNFPGPLKAWLL